MNFRSVVPLTSRLRSRFVLCPPSRAPPALDVPEHAGGCRAMLKWKEVSLETLEHMLSTGEAQSLAPEARPPWAQTTAGFSGAWFSYVGAPSLRRPARYPRDTCRATSNVERTATKQPPLRYHRHLYVKMADGRVFHAGPIKNLEYKRHRGRGRNGSPPTSPDRQSPADVQLFDRPTAGSHALAAAGRRGRWTSETTNG